MDNQKFVAAVLCVVGSIVVLLVALAVDWEPKKKWRGPSGRVQWTQEDKDRYREASRRAAEERRHQETMQALRDIEWEVRSSQPTRPR